jgi:hypothetical protein
MPCKASYIASISQLLCSVVLCIICGRLTHVPITHWTRSTVAAARTLRTYATPHHFTSKPYRAVVAFRAIAHRSLGFTRAPHASPLHVSRACHSVCPCWGPPVKSKSCSPAIHTIVYGRRIFFHHDSGLPFLDLRFVVYLEKKRVCVSFMVAEIWGSSSPLVIYYFEKLGDETVGQIKYTHALGFYICHLKSSEMMWYSSLVRHA